jgi:zinc protease
MKRLALITKLSAVGLLLATIGAGATTPIPAVSLGQLERRALDHGAQLVVLPDTGAAQASAFLCFRGGRALEPESQAGVSSMLAALIAGDASVAGSFAAWLSSSGGKLETQVLDDEFRLVLRVAPAALAEAAARLGERLAHPACDAAELERVRASLEASARQRAGDASARADASLQALAYGSAWRGAERAGSFELRAITIEALLAFEREQTAASRLVVGVTGPVEAAAQEELWRGALASLQVETTREPSPPAFVQPPERRVWIVDDPGRTEIELRIAGPGVRWNDPDWAALELWSALLAGRVASASQAGKLPIDHARAGFERGASRKGIFRAGGTTTAEHAVEAITALLGVLESAARDVAADELETARRSLADASAAADALAESKLLLGLELTLHGYPEDHAEQVRERELRLGASEVRDAVGRHLDPARLLVLVVGPANRMLEPLARLGRTTRYEPLVDALLASVGGRERWASLASLEIESTVQPAVGQVLQTHQWLDLEEPRYRVETPAANGTQVIVLDGRDAFNRLGDQVTEFPAATARTLFARHARGLWNVLHHLALGRGVVSRQDGERRLVLTLEEGSELVLEIDEKGRPARVQYQEDGDRRTLVYEDWRESEGYTWAAHVREEPTGRLWDISRFQPLRSFDPALVAR